MNKKYIDNQCSLERTTIQYVKVSQRQFYPLSICKMLRRFIQFDN